MHELHVWSLNQYKTIATAHIVTVDQSLNAFMNRARIIRECFHAYGVHSVTLQAESVGQFDHETTENTDGVHILEGHEGIRQRAAQSRQSCIIKCSDACVDLVCCT